jgi:predicted ATPase/DNA-binding CsgD family transcriptional regulator/DNA-binding XRE family transcriptional regulator
MDRNPTFGTWLKQRRKALDLTRESLADRVGCSWETIRKIEDGARRPSLQMAELLAEHLAVPSEERVAFVQFARAAGDEYTPVFTFSGPQRAARPVPTSPNNLPTERTPFVGREDVAEVAGLLSRRETRLLTLTGPAGIGKTRLSLEVAGRMLASFPDGVFFVPLASVSDPALVAPAIAQTLGLKELPNQPITSSLLSFLRGRRMMLVLDNFEQVVAAGPIVAEISAEARHVKILVSSRECLHVQGEREYAVPPLSLPPRDARRDAEALSQYEAVQLFVQQASLARPGFRLDDDNAPVVAEICRKVDGIPLAIELAAARVKILSPAALLARLDQRLQVLTGGAHDLPTRQQTLRSAIDWSYDGLEEQEKVLFARLGVFAGGATLHAVEQVVGPIGGMQSDFLDCITSLIDKSLVKQREEVDGEIRFYMLETIREYALERLAESGEAEDISLKHAEYYLRLAEEAETHLQGAYRAEWLARLARDLDNLRAVLDWCVSRGGDCEIAARVAGALDEFWHYGGRMREGRKWLVGVLAPGSGVTGRTPGRAKALYAAGKLAALYGSDMPTAATLLEESATIWRESGARRELAYAVSWLGVVRCIMGDRAGLEYLTEALGTFRELDDKAGMALALETLADAGLALGDDSRGSSLYEESLALYREIGNTMRVAEMLSQIARMAMYNGDYTRARARFEEVLEMERESNDKWRIAHLLRGLGDLAHLEDDFEQAEQLYTEALGYYRDVGDELRAAALARSLGHTAQHQGNLDRAQSLFVESLNSYMTGRHYMGAVLSLSGITGVLAARGQLRWAAYVLGIGDALHTIVRVRAPTLGLTEYDRNRAAVQAALTAKELEEEYGRGRSLSQEEARDAIRRLVYVDLPAGEPSEHSPGASAAYQPKLTARESDVLRLLAAGMSNGQIAEELGISDRTVGAHLNSIYTKIGISSRTAAAAFATEQGLTGEPPD